MKKTVKFCVAMIFAGLVAHSAQATLVTYNWVPDAPNNTSTSSGSLIYNTSSGLVTQFSWKANDGTVDAYFLQFLVTVLAGGDLQLRGYGQTSATSNADLVQWLPLASTGTDQNFSGDNSGLYFGDWVKSAAVVPEPTTVLSGALLLLPLGAGVLRRMGKV